MLSACVRLARFFNSYIFPTIGAVESQFHFKLWRHYSAQALVVHISLTAEEILACLLFGPSTSAISSLITTCIVCVCVNCICLIIHGHVHVQARVFPSVTTQLFRLHLAPCNVQKYASEDVI